MQVSFVSKQLNVGKGGSNYSLDILARMLSARGHDVRVLTMKPELNVLPDERGYAVVEPDVSPLPTRAGMAVTQSSLLDEWAAQTDIFHIFNPNFLTGGAVYRRLGGSVPLVGRLNSYNFFCTNLDEMDGHCHRHCTAVTKFRHSYRSLSDRTAAMPLYVSRTHLEPSMINTHFERLFAISPAVGEIYEQNGIDTDLIDVVPNCYDPAFDVDEPPERGDEPFRLLALGRLIDAKNVSLLLDALTLVDGAPHLDIVGDGDELDSLVARASELGIRDRVTFHGWVEYDDVTEYYDRADVLVHPGKWPEPFGRTILEALQRYTPPIVSDVGAPPWIVGDAGFVFRSNDPVDLAETIEAAMAGSALEDRRSRCHERVSTFAPERTVDAIETTYEQIVGVG